MNLSPIIAPALLQVQGLSIEMPTQHGMTRLVDNVSFSLAPNRILGLVGESGSGKSITCSGIAGLLPHSARVSGEVLFDGRDLLRQPPRAMADIRGAEIGYIFQDPMSCLNPSLTIGRQIGETLARHLGLGKAATRARSIELLEMVGIAGAAQRLDSYPHEMSGGMRQRVLIAMAISCRPKLLIADEPTTALDVTVQAQILQLLRDMQNELAMSVIFITHDLGALADLCDDVVVMYAGETVESNDIFSLFDNPRHPYTQQLIRAVDRADQTRLATISGVPPSAGQWPTGCRFAPRCPHAQALCASHPAWLQSQNARLRCHYPLSPQGVRV